MICQEELYGVASIRLTGYDTEGTTRIPNVPAGVISVGFLGSVRADGEYQEARIEQSDRHYGHRLLSNYSCCFTWSCYGGWDRVLCESSRSDRRLGLFCYSSLEKLLPLLLECLR